MVGIVERKKEETYVDGIECYYYYYFISVSYCEKL